MRRLGNVGILFLALVLALGAVAAGGAHFTSNATNTGNELGADNFSIRLAGQDADGSQFLDDDSPLFDVSNLVPGGDSATAYLEVKNTSDIDALFRVYLTNCWQSEDGFNQLLNAEVTLRPEELGDEYTQVLSGDPYGPSEGVQVYDGTVADLQGVDNALDNLSAWREDPSWPLEPGFVAVYKIEVSLDFGAGNEYQDATYNADVQVDATQAVGQEKWDVQW